MRRVTHALDVQSRLSLKRYGLTGPQIALLRELTVRRSTSVGDLARALDLTQATVTVMLARLHERGMVTRVRDGADRRRVLVGITPQGLGAIRGIPEFFSDQLTGLVNQHPREWQLILRSLQRLADMLEPDPEPAPDAACLRAEGTLLAHATLTPPERIPD